MAKNKTSRVAACLMAIVLIVTSMCCMGTVAASAAGTYGTTIYLQTDNTTNPYIHYWVGSGGNENSSTWPGVQMTKVEGETNIYSYNLPCDVGTLSGVIFCNGGGGNKMTGDVTDISGNMYTLNGSVGTWSVFDVDAMRLAVETDVASPQYTETDIAIKATVAKAQGAVTYTFKAGTTTLYTGTNSTYTWSPTTAGTYTITVKAVDSVGNSIEKSIEYTIKDDSLAVEPVLKGISTGYTGSVPVNTSIPVNVKATGGNVGTNLLFYKVAITDPNGGAVNTVYYKQSNILNFTPTVKGDYSVDVSVQNSKNTTVKKSYTVTVGDGGTDIAPQIASFTVNPASGTVGSGVVFSTTVTDGTGTADFTYTYRINGVAVSTQTSSLRSNSYTWTPTAAGSYTIQLTVKDSKNLSDNKYIYKYVVAEKPTETPTETPTLPPQPCIGDVNGDGSVTIADAIYVLRYVANKSGYTLEPGSDKFKAADVDGNGTVNMVDAMKILQLV